MALRCAPTIGPRARRELGIAPPLARPISRTRSYHGGTPGARSEHAPSVPFTRSEHAGSARGVSPAKYDPAKALPLRVSPELREALDALTARLPAALRLPRNTVAALALARGVEELGAELARDPMALHRALAGEAAPTAAERAPSTSKTRSERTPRERPPRSETAPRGTRASSDAAPGALADVEAAEAPSEAPSDAEALRDRWRRSGLGVTAFAARHGIARSILREWLHGAATRPATLAKIAAALESEKK